MSEENKEKKTLTPKQQFWIRFVLWTLFACVLPISFIIWRYDLFRVVSKIQVGGWGLVAIVILLVFAITLARYLKSGMVKWSMTKQIMTGIVKVMIPLIGVYFIVYSMRESIDLFLQALACAILCEGIAIPINPMPKWVYEQSMGKSEDLIDYYFKRNNDTKGELK